MIEFDVFPGGKRRVVTFSYDDGPDADERLIALFDKYGVKGTFHLNGRKYIGADEATLASLRERYKNHEIACHTMQHGDPEIMAPSSVVQETIEDRRVLEKIAQYPVIGMSYPSGSWNDDVISAMRSCGITYSRTTQNTKNFHFPRDFMEWHPTCHHRDAMEVADRFIENLHSRWIYPLFYIWGHAHEFRCEEDWAYIEKLVAKIAGLDNVWYATNGEIYRYVMAGKRLEISADECVFRNVSDIDVWVDRNNGEILCIPAGKTVTL